MGYSTVFQEIHSAYFFHLNNLTRNMDRKHYMQCQSWCSKIVNRVRLIVYVKHFMAFSIFSVGQCNTYCNTCRKLLKLKGSEGFQLLHHCCYTKQGGIIVWPKMDLINHPPTFSFIIKHTEKYNLHKKKFRFWNMGKTCILQTGNQATFFMITV